MKLKILDRFKKKPSKEEKGDWTFNCNKGTYCIEYAITTEKGALFKAFNSVKHILPHQAKKGNRDVLDSGKEIIIDSRALKKIEPTIVIALNPNKSIFPEIKHDLPKFTHYNIKLTFASIKQIKENLYFMKIKLEGLCDGDE